MALLKLPTVTLCAATSVNVDATLAAIEASCEGIAFGDVILFTDASPVPVPAHVRIVPIEPLRSGADYSAFILQRLASHLRTEHCLVVQWDGFVLEPEQWDGAFLEYDYIGATWPQFDDDHDVGNGGFSLRSKRLLEACADADFVRSHPEDVAICRSNRTFLEERFGIRFGDRDTAARFSFERSRPAQPSFGFHGVFNMIEAVGEDRFWFLYRRLDERSSVARDLGLILRQLRGPRRLSRRVRMMLDRAGDLLRAQSPRRL